MNTITIRKVALVNKENITGNTAKKYIKCYNLFENENEIDIMPILIMLGVTNIKSNNNESIELTINQADIEIINCISELFDSKDVTIKPVEVPDAYGNYTGYYELKVTIK